MRPLLTKSFHPAGRPRAALKRKGTRAAKMSEKAVKRRRMVGGVLKHIGTAAPGQQCTHCGTQVRLQRAATPFRHHCGSPTELSAVSSCVSVEHAGHPCCSPVHAYRRCLPARPRPPALVMMCRPCAQELENRGTANRSTELLCVPTGDPGVARGPLRPQDALQRLRRALHEAGQEEVRPALTQRSPGLRHARGRCGQPLPQYRLTVAAQKPARSFGT